MDVDLEMEKLRNVDPAHLDPKYLPSLEKMAQLTAVGLYRMASHMAFALWQDKTYRSLIQLEKLPKVEQDRIFNELVVAGLTVFMLTLDAPDLRVEKEMKEYYGLLRDEIPRAHLAELKRLGIEKKHLKIWKKLIAMRYEEYVQAKLNARSAAMEFEGQRKRLTASDLDGIHAYLPPFVVSVGCHKHIFRGKTEGHDLAFKYLMKKLSRFYVPARAAIEGRRINPAMYTLMKLHHLWNDLTDWKTFQR